VYGTVAKSAKKVSGSKKRGHRKPRRTWNSYISKSLKQVKKGLTLSSKTVKILNSFVNDIFDRVAVEAANLARINKRGTLGSREVQTAVRLTLPVELAKHAIAEGTKAVAKVAA